MTEPVRNGWEIGVLLIVLIIILLLGFGGGFEYYGYRGRAAASG